MRKLTEAEEKVMHYLWDLKEATVRDIDEVMKEDISRSTISSIVRILEKKGFVDHKAYGRTYLYFPIIDKHRYSRNSITDFVKKYFSGSTEKMVHFLVEKEEINPEELKKIVDRFKDEGDAV